MTLAVVVRFRLHPGGAERFMPLMHENAATSLAVEPGCTRFDVLTDPGRPDEVLLYELYDDRAAFDVHLRSAHFRAFDEATSNLVAEKHVELFREVGP